MCARVTLALVCIFACLPARGASRVGREALSVLSPALREAALQGGAADLPVTVVLCGSAESPAMVKHARIVQVAGLRLLRGTVAPGELLRLAGRPGVEAVEDAGPRPAPDRLHPDDARRQPLPREAFLSALARASPLASPPRAKPRDYGRDSWIGNDLIGVSEAWKKGFHGEGVKVAIMDSGIDFAHPDLSGTMARITDPNSPHYGWPICFDGRSLADYAATHLIEGTWYANTAFAPGVTVYDATATTYVYVVRNGHTDYLPYTFRKQSVSGVYHFGAHPDPAFTRLYGERPSILVVDHPDTAHRGPGYNTVYVDLNRNYDFTDDKPCFRGDEVSYADVWDSAAGAPGQDGYADVSGGMVYFIANGTRRLPASDWLYDLAAPSRGSLVAFMLDSKDEQGGEHGTLCASAVAAQGIINGAPPAVKPPYQGPGDGLVQGPARGAGLIAMGDFYAGGYVTDFFLFSALSYDGRPDTDDDAQIVSMSFGYNESRNEGWDYESRFLARLSRLVAPHTTWMKSSGNSAPGYGNLSGFTGARTIQVGASTQYGSEGAFDSIADKSQITEGDAMTWSSAGVQATGAPGVAVLANGAWGTGDLPLNSVHDGWTAWESWGGTSRACPEAAGVLALAYQAYKSVHDRFPTSLEARQLLMNSAQDLHHDALRQGAGRDQAARAVELAAGTGGVSADPPLWWAGDYRGRIFEDYTRLVHRGDVRDASLLLTHHGSAPVTLDVTDVEMRAIGAYEFSFSTVKSPSEFASVVQPHYLQLLEGPGVHHIPADADLLVVEAIFPFEDFDTDYVPPRPETVKPGPENQYRLVVYDWSDRDGDSKLYDDSLGSLPGVIEPGEMDAGEYMRFTYGYLPATALKAFVARPLERMHTGVWIGLIHHNSPPEGYATTMRVRVRFFKEVDCPWITEEAASITLPAGASQVFNCTLSVPADLPYGPYAAKLLFSPRNRPATETLVVPFVMNVAAEWSGGPLAFGAPSDASRLPDVGRLGGDFGWVAARREGGDNRCYFLDVKNPQPGDHLALKTWWEDDPPCDVDTLILAPLMDAFTTPGSLLFDPAFGPGTLVESGGFASPRRLDRVYQTSTGGPADYNVLDPRDGLYLLGLQNVLSSGRNFSIPVHVDGGVVNVQPAPLHYYTTAPAPILGVTVTADFPIANFTVTPYGPSRTEHYLDQPIADHAMPGAGTSWTHDFFCNSTALLDVRLRSSASDLDLYIYRDGQDGSAPDSQFNYPGEVYDLGFGNASDVTLREEFPPDGYYRVAVYAYATAGVEHFDLDLLNLQGRNGFIIQPFQMGNLEPGVPKSFTLSPYLVDRADYRTCVAMGPSDATTLLCVDMDLTYYQPGDADNDGKADYRDALLLSTYWRSGEGVPAGLDINHDGVLDEADLVGLIPPPQ